MWGLPLHLAEVDRIIRKTKPDPAPDGARLHVLLASTNSENATYDGIDWGAERVVKEIYECVSSLEEKGSTVTKLSITGYSLGGLISRYLIGILRQRGFFDKVTPVNFNTIATPHIGLLKYHSLFSSLSSTLGPKLLSRTGEQFYCVDKYSNTGRPLLQVMADPEFVFYQALASFQHLRIYANAVNDITVPFVTAAIELHDPFNDYETSGIEITYDEYKPVIVSYQLPEVPPPKPKKALPFTPRWFRERKPFLPPFLQFRFPFNILMYIALPFLIPVFFSMALTRLWLASRSSQRRIKILESDSSSERLIHFIASLERRVEDAVAELVDRPGEEDTKKKGKGKTSQPYLLPLQREIAASLNKLPFKKTFAYFPDVRNAHAVIVSRDVKRFEFHRRGEGVIQHWADNFVL